MEAETLALAQEMDFSMWALFARATFIVKLVMLMLILASFWAWSIIIQKLITYRKARREAEIFDRRFWSGEPLDAFRERMAALTEWLAGRDEAVIGLTCHWGVLAALTGTSFENNEVRRIPLSELRVRTDVEY